MGLLDPQWKYTPSTATDIRKTFAKARRELAHMRPLTGQRRANKPMQSVAVGK